MKRRAFLQAAVGVAAGAVVPACVAQLHPYPFTEWMVIARTGVKVLMRQRWDEDWYDLIEIRPDGTEARYGGVAAWWLCERGQTPEDHLREFAQLAAVR